MNILIEGLLDERDQARRNAVAARWQRTDLAPEERLLRFDAWIELRLAEKLDWTWAGANRRRRILQCSVYMRRVVLDLWRRGWMLDGQRLAAHLIKLLDAVGAQQRAGKVKDFWPYFRAAANRYVGLNAEEISEEAIRAGSHIAHALAGAGIRLSETLPELMAQRAAEVSESKALRQRLSARRKALKLDGQLPLL
jgi:hypothetical protein